MTAQSQPSQTAPSGGESQTGPKYPQLSFSRVPPELVDFVFSRLGREIGRGIRHGAGDATTPDYLRAAIKRGDMLMWAIQSGPDVIACVVLSVKQYAAKTTVFVEMVAGREMDLWVEPLEELLRDYRDLIGADTVEAFCRDGMARRLSRWKRKAVLMELVDG